MARTAATPVTDKKQEGNPAMQPRPGLTKKSLATIALFTFIVVASMVLLFIITYGGREI